MPDFTGFCHILCLQSYFPKLKSHSGPSINLVSLFCIFIFFIESSLSLLSRNPRSSIAMCNCSSLCPSVPWSCLWAQPKVTGEGHHWCHPWAWPIELDTKGYFCSAAHPFTSVDCPLWFAALGHPRHSLPEKKGAWPLWCILLYFIIYFFPTLMNKEWVHLQGRTCKGKSISWLTDRIREVAL